MEGLTPFFILLGMGAGFALLLWLLFKYKVLGNVLSVVGAGSEFAKFIVSMLFPNDKEKQDKYLKYIILIQSGVQQVEMSKADIQARMKAEGWDETDRTKLHEAYTQEALEIAEYLGKMQGLEFDSVTKEVCRMAVKLILSFFREKGSEPVTVIDPTNTGVQKIAQDQDGSFRPVSG